MGEAKRGHKGETPVRTGSMYARIWNPNRGTTIKTYDGAVYQVQDNGSWKKKGIRIG